MKIKYLLLSIIILIFLSGCVDTTKQASKIEQLTDENAELKDQIFELESQVVSLKNNFNEVLEERNDYEKQLDEFYLTKITGDIDLTNWDREHIVRALGYYNDKFKSTAWYSYDYRLDQKDFYWTQNTSLGFVPDPFFELKRKKKDSEFVNFHLRLERLDLTTVVDASNAVTFVSNKTVALEKYNEYVDDVLRESQIDLDLTCYKQTSCRDIKVIKCSKDNKNYYSWFEGSHLFTTRFDNREALNAFEEFYCRPDLYASLL